MNLTRINFIFTLFIISLLSTHCNSQAPMKVETVKNLELSKYLGKWYEIARLPHSFEKNMMNVTAIYSMRSDGKIAVVNEGYLFSANGKYKIANGKAWIPDPSVPSKLKVQFFWPFSGDYYVVDLEPNYQYALILSSSPNYFWILSRTKKLDDAIVQQLISKAVNYGINREKIIMVEHN